MAKEESQMSNTDRRIQVVSEQTNWTNVALRGMDAHTFVTNDFARRRHIEQLHIYIPEKENIRYIHSGKLYIYICHKSVYQSATKKHSLPSDRAEDIMEWRKMLWQPHEPG